MHRIADPRSLCASLLVALSLVAAAQDDAGSIESVRAKAEAAWTARDYETAALRYRELTGLEPKGATAWYRLGYSLHALGRLDEALPAHENAARFAGEGEEDVRAFGLYNAACVHARLGHPGEALAALERARAAGFANATSLERDEDFASIRGDARFAALLEAMKSKGRRKVAIIVHEGVEMLDFAGPAEVFSAASTRLGGPSYEVLLVAPGKGPVHAQNVAGAITPAFSIADCPQVDVLLVPGGDTNVLLNDAAFLEWFRGAAAHADHVVSVCTGAFVLAKLGMLDGKEATTHHSSQANLRREHPQIGVLENVRFVDNGKEIVAGGVSAGIDAALRVVARDLGEPAAVGVARYIEHAWPPPPEAVRIRPAAAREDAVR